MMVGRSVDAVFPKIEVNIGEVVFKAENLTREGYFKNVSFELRKGEILGFTGLSAQAGARSCAQFLG